MAVRAFRARKAARGKRARICPERGKALSLYTAQMAQVRAPTSQMAQRAGSQRAHGLAGFRATKGARTAGALTRTLLGHKGHLSGHKGHVHSGLTCAGLLGHKSCSGAYELGVHESIPTRARRARDSQITDADEEEKIREKN